MIQQNSPEKCEPIPMKQPRIDPAANFLTKKTPLDDNMHALLEIVGQVPFQALLGRLQRGHCKVGKQAGNGVALVSTSYT